MGSFAYSSEINEVFKLLPFSSKLSPEEQEQFISAVDLLVDRDDELSAWSSNALTGDRGSTVIAATAGGATIAFNRSLGRVPTTIHLSLGDDAGGAVPNLVPASKTETEFDVQVRDAAGVELVGAESIRIEWIAVL